MVSKGKLRLTPDNEYYELYAGLWFDIVSISSSGLLTCSVDKGSTKQIIHIKDGYEMYEHYISKFSKNNKKSEYKPIFQDEFEALLKNRIDLIHESLVVKGKEYASNGREDRMHNFIAAIKMNNETPEKSLHGMLTKHLISYQDIINDLDKGIIPSENYIKEKYGDIINYFILSEMLILNRIKNDH